MSAFFTKQLRRRKYDAPVERALFALVAHPLVDPSSKLACWDWIENDAYLPDGRGLSVIAKFEGGQITNIQGTPGVIGRCV